MALEFKDVGILVTGGLSIISFIRLHRRDGVEEQRKIADEALKAERSLTVMETDLKHVVASLDQISAQTQKDIPQTLAQMEVRITRIETILALRDKKPTSDN